MKKTSKCNFQKSYDKNLHYAVTGSSFDEYLDVEVPCMSCGKKAKFGQMHLIFCSNECSFYHKQVCQSCFDKKVN